MAEPSVRDVFLEMASMPHVASGCEYQAYSSRLLDWDYKPGIGWLREVPGNHGTLFTAHADMVLRGSERPYRLVVEGDIARGEGHNIGADDRAGMALLLTMTQNRVPGRYAIFEREEIKRLGSMAFASQPANLSGLSHCISFDRKGDCSVVTHQKAQRLCSDACASRLRDQLNAHGLNLELDTNGVGTDSYSIWFYNNSIECVNISIGYMNAHTVDEYQDMAYLHRLTSAVMAGPWSDSLSGWNR